MAGTESEQVVLGVDLGTTSTKVVAGTRHGHVLHQTECGYPLRTDEPGEAVQDPDAVRDAAIEAVADCVKWTGAQGHEVVGLSFSTAMHTLVGLDDSGTAVTPAFTWADTRAADVARRLREDASSPDLHRATGTPVHTQSVMVKLAWLNSERSDLANSAVRWCGLKDVVLAAFNGERDALVAEHSLASGTGLQSMAHLAWHEPALEVAGVGADQLPPLRAPVESVPLSAQVAHAVGLPQGLPVVLGGGDGPLANLGVGAIEPGVAALSLGTSGALRVVRDEPGIDERCRTFSYALADGRWVIGGAVSNGGVVGQWAADAFGVEVPELLEEAATVPPGADGLVALPYLLGERAPWWEPGLTGALVGLRRYHGRAEITRAIVEGVAQQLALVQEGVRDAGAEVRSVRATGGGFRSRVWATAIAAALERELHLSDAEAGSGLGAVLLGWRALGALDSLDEASSLVTPRETVSPDREAARLLAERRHSVEELARIVRELVPGTD